MFFVPLILAATQMAGSYMQSQGIEEQGAAAKRIGEFNAKVDETDALQTELNSLETVRRMRVDAKKFKGTQRVKFAKSGVLETGTPLEVMSETAGMLQLQEMEQAQQADAQAKNLRRRAQVSRFTGETEMRASQTQASASLLSGAANAVGTYYNLRN